jgi:hypothetical protein
VYPSGTGVLSRKLGGFRSRQKRLSLPGDLVKKEFKLCKADLGHSSFPSGKLSFHLSVGMQFFPPQVTLGKTGIFAKKEEEIQVLLARVGRGSF